MGADPATLFLVSAGISATGSLVQMQQQRAAAAEKRDNFVDRRFAPL